MAVILDRADIIVGLTPVNHLPHIFVSQLAKQNKVQYRSKRTCDKESFCRSHFGGKFHNLLPYGIDKPRHCIVHTTLYYCLKNCTLDISDDIYYADLHANYYQLYSQLTARFHWVAINFQLGNTPPASIDKNVGYSITLLTNVVLTSLNYSKYLWTSNF